MTADDFYLSAEQLLVSISDNLLVIQHTTQAVLILLCGMCLYHIFWGRK